MQDIIDQIKGRIEVTERELTGQRQAAAAIPETERHLARLQAALKALNSKQTPEGRKRIGEAAKQRKPKPDVSVAAASAAPQCGECHGFGTMGTATAPCTADGCEAHVCGACSPSHNARWHQEVA